MQGTTAVTGSSVQSIPGLAGYFVDADGRVFSRWKRSGLRSLAPDGELRELRQFDRRRKDGSASPYLSVTLGRGRTHYVQRLVLLAFVGAPPSPTHEACHRNGNARDNRPDNLRWGTKEENTDDRHAHDAFARGWETRREVHAFSDLLDSAAE